MSQSKRNKTNPASVRPTKSRTPFFILIAAIAAIGASAIVYKMNSAPKPIVLSQGTNLLVAEGHLLGDPKAPVSIMEFADFECPVCANWATVTEPDVRTRIVEKGLANLRFYDFPIPELHPNTLFAALAGSCAADQNKFWEMHDALMAGQLDWEGKNNKNPKPVFDTYVKRIGLDAGKFNACFDARDNVAKVEANHKAGVDYQINGTPSFVIAGKMYPYTLSYDQIKTIVDSVRTSLGVVDSSKAGTVDAAAATKVPVKN